MTPTEQVQELFEIHESLFESLIMKTNGEIKMPLFSIQAPGHIGVDYLEIPNLRATFENFPNEIKERLNKVLSSGKFSEKFSLENNGLRTGLQSCFVNGFTHYYHLAAVSNPLNRYGAFLELAQKHSEEIASWLNEGTKSKNILVIFQPKIEMGQYTNFSDWKHAPRSLPELCIEAYQGWQSGQEAAERVFSSSFFVRDMKTMPSTKDEILAEVDVLTLALWLSLGNIYRPQDIRFERRPWRFSPDEKTLLGFNFRPFWDNSRENFSLQMSVRSNAHKLDWGNKINAQFYDRAINWLEVISSNRKSIYSLNIINDGARDIARSFVEQSFRRERIARDGIYKILSGLEGLNTECKPINNGYKTRAQKTFVECWSNIWQKILLADPSQPVLSKTQNIKEALKDIYSLRSDLAHSDPTSLTASLKKVKSSCGDTFNPRQYDPVSVGKTILMIVDELLEYFYINKPVLTNLLNGTKPS